jgi:hypothetical protein
MVFWLCRNKAVGCTGLALVHSDLAQFWRLSVLGTPATGSGVLGSVEAPMRRAVFVCGVVFAIACIQPRCHAQVVRRDYIRVWPRGIYSLAT